MPADARRAVELLGMRWQEFSDLKALAEVRLDQGNAKQQFIGALLVKAPTSFRFEALSPLGQPMMLATVNDGQLTVYDVGANSATVEPATPKTAARLIHLALDPDDLVGLLAGYAVPPQDLRVATVLPADEHGPSLEMIGAIHRQRVWMDLETGRVSRVLVTGGRIESLFVYERDAEGTLTGLEFTAVQGNVKGGMRYRDVVVGAGIDIERFRLTLPVGAVVERLR